MKIFLDTSALIAYYNADDTYHAEAHQAMEEIKTGKIPLTRFYITDYIFDETITFIECVLNRHHLALKVGEALQTSPFTTMIPINKDLFQKSWNFFKENTNYSFIDCTSLKAKEKHGITEAFTFDKHFQNAGFQTIP